MTTAHDSHLSSLRGRQGKLLFVELKPCTGWAEPKLLPRAPQPLQLAVATAARRTAGSLSSGTDEVGEPFSSAHEPLFQFPATGKEQQCPKPRVKVPLLLFTPKAQPPEAPSLC